MITDKEKNFISAVVYVRNNAEILENFIETLNNTLNVFHPMIKIRLLMLIIFKLKRIYYGC